MATARATRVASLQLGIITTEIGVISAVQDESAGLVSFCRHSGRWKCPTDGGFVAVGQKCERCGKAQPKVAEAGPPSRIKRTDHCPDCGNEDKDTFVKGKMVGDSAVVINTEQLAAVAAADEAAKKTIVLTAHPAAELAAAFPSGKSYYLAPRGPAAAGNYALIAEVLKRKPEIALVGEFSFGGPAALYQVVVDGDVLVMRQLARPDMVRERPTIEGEANEQYLTLVQQFVEAICTTFDPAAYRSRRAAALADLLAAATPVALNGSAPAAAPVTDLADQLKAAIAKAGSPPAGKKTTRSKKIA